MDSFMNVLALGARAIDGIIYDLNRDLAHPILNGREIALETVRHDQSPGDAAMKTAGTADGSCRRARSTPYGLGRADEVIELASLMASCGIERRF
jgi:hypothetical protein